MTLLSLRVALRDPDARVRSQAARAIGYMGPDAAEAAPDLVRMIMTDADAADAVDALCEIGEAAVEHVRPLLDGDERLRGAALNILRMIGIQKDN